MRDLSRALFELYEPAPSVPVDDFAALCCHWLKARLPFDSGAVGTMFYGPRSVGYQAFHLHQQPVEKVLEYPSIAHLDRAAIGMVRNVGRASAYFVARDLAPDSSNDPMRRYARRFGVAQSLTYCTRVGDSGDAFALWRGSERKPFLATQARLAEALAPHLFLALKINTTRFLAPSIGDEAQSVAVVAQGNGFITACDSRAIDLIAGEWPGWGPPMLPAALLDGLARSSERAHVGRTLRARCTVVGNLLVIRLTRHGASRLLTPAQARVADRLGRSGSYKEIARELGLSPATVRNHAHAVYSRLGIVSRAGLAERMARGDTGV